MKLAFIIDRLSLLDPTHDTSVAMMEAAQLLGHEVWVTGKSCKKKGISSVSFSTMR
jgi:glutathione synthase/RimK-type ligase-like ATP-grasp enzyme